MTVPRPLIFQEGSWFQVSRGGLVEQFSIELTAKALVPSGPSWACTMENKEQKQTRYGPEQHELVYYMGKRACKVQPPKIGASGVEVLLRHAAPEVLDSPDAQVILEACQGILLRMGREYFKMYYCGVVDTKSSSLLFYEPEHYHPFLSYFPEGTWGDMGLGRGTRAAAIQACYQRDLRLLADRNPLAIMNNNVCMSSTEKAWWRDHHGENPDLFT